MVNYRRRILEGTLTSRGAMEGKESMVVSNQVDSMIELLAISMNLGRSGEAMAYSLRL